MCVNVHSQKRPRFADNLHEFVVPDYKESVYRILSLERYLLDVLKKAGQEDLCHKVTDFVSQYDSQILPFLPAILKVSRSELQKDVRFKNDVLLLFLKSIGQKHQE